MSKNLTLKGAAFGALVALSISAVAPASAAGLADTSYITLAPTSGTAYATIAEAGQTFSLTANEASSIVSGNLKFLVKDSSGLIQPNYATTAQTLTPAIDDNLPVTLDAAANTITITDSDLADALVEGARVSLSANLLIGDDATSVNPAIKVANTQKTLVVGAVDTTNDTVVLNSDMDITSVETATGVAADTVAGAVNVKLLAGPRHATENTYVVNSNVASSSSDEVLVLEADGTTTRSVEITAWVDANGNKLIDGSEYVSPTRTVTFKKYSEVVPSLTWTPVTVGAETIEVKVATEPKLNWDQLTNSKIAVDFTRQGSTATVVGGSETWSDTTGLWTISKSLKETAASPATWTGFKTPAALTIAASATSPVITHYSQSGTTATFTTGAAHNLSVNDTITVTSFLASAASAKITAVTDYTFSYTTSATAATTAKTVIGNNTPSVAVTGYAFATAGTYTADVKIGSTPAKIGSTFTSSAAVAVADTVKNVPTTSSDVNASFKVRKSYTGSVVVTSTVKDADAVAVGAGVPVSIAVTETSAGTVVVNGVTVSGSKTIDATTNASGQVVITTTNSAAAAGDTVQLAVTAQGKSDTDTLTWEAAVYKLVDSADVNTASANVNRVIAKNGTASMNVEVIDQFLKALTNTARVKVVLAGTRWSSTSYQDLSNGKATITITDSPVAIATLNPTATLTVQTKNTAGSWVDADGNTDVVTDFLHGNGDLDTRATTFNVLTGNGSKVVLNADAVGSADLTVPVASEATAVSDERANQTAVDFGSTTDVTASITGHVADASTEATVLGHTVTVSGNSAILFRVGAKSAFGSLTFVAGAAGDFTIDAFSNKALKDSVVTVASNGASKTVKLNFTALAAKSMTVTAPSTAKSGNVVNVTATLLDKWGNASTTTGTITFEAGTIGYLTNDAAVTVVSGKARVKLVLGSSDKGVTSVSATASDLDDADGVDVTVSKTILVSVSASITKPAKGATTVVKYAKGATIKVVRGTKSVTKVATSNTQKVTLKSGTGKVTVYVDGVKVASK